MLPLRRVGRPGRESVGLSKAAAVLAAVDPFAPAAAPRHEPSGRRLGGRTIHRVARWAGAVASERERQLALQMATWSVPADGGAEARPARLYVAVDGVTVHRDQWNEAKTAACYWEVPGGGGAPPRETRHAARFESAEPFRASA